MLKRLVAQWRPVRVARMAHALIHRAGVAAHRRVRRRSQARAKRARRATSDSATPHVSPPRIPFDWGQVGIGEDARPRSGRLWTKGLEILALACLTMTSAVGAWSLFVATGKTPQTQVAKYYRLDGVSLLVDRPGVKGEFGLNCTVIKGLNDRWCALGLAFAPSVEAGTRWAIGFAAGLRLEGEGKVLRGQPSINGRRVYQAFPGERFPFGVVTIYPGRHPSHVLQASSTAAGGVVITGTVTRTGVRASWAPVETSHYAGEIPAMVGQRRVAYGFQLPVDLESRENGIIAGALPHIGTVGDRYFLTDHPKVSWQAPQVSYFASVLEPDVEDQLLGDLQTQPRIKGDRRLYWNEQQPFQARWTFTQASQVSNSRRRVFFGGVLVSLVGGFLVALIQALAHVRSRS